MKNTILKGLAIAGFAGVVALGIASCGNNEGGDTSLEGEVKADGSSTVFPITEAVAEEFGKKYPRVKVTVGLSGTGGGFKKFGAGETDISDASRPIKASEAAKCKENGIEYIELPVAFDGLSVVVHKDNDFVNHLTIEELRKIWQPGSTVKNWSEVRPGWPAEEIRLYGPGTDSGTFDYFTEAVNGKSGASRDDYQASEDDNQLVVGVAGDKYSLGYFGFAYYAENKDKMKVVPIDGGNGPVAPSETTINDGTYSPLSRPIFIYVAKKSTERKEVDEFIKFYLAQAPKLVADVGYVALPAKAYELAMERYTKRVTGSAFEGVKPGMKIEDVMKLEQ